MKEITQISVITHVVMSNGTLELATHITGNGCIVKFPPDDIFISWEEMTDVDRLSELFSNVPVRIFVPVVRLMGKIYNGRDAFKLIV